MSNILLGQAIITKLKTLSDLVSEGLIPTADGHIGQKLKNVKEILPYIAVEFRPTRGVRPELATPKRTAIRIITYSTDELTCLRMMDIIQESIENGTPYWDISDSNIDNVYTEFQYRDTLEEDFDKYTDVFMDALEIDITWRILCDEDPSVDVEACPDSSDARDPDISC